MVVSYRKQLMIALGVEQKRLPSRVVNDEARARAEALKATQGYKPGKKQLREITEKVTVELLPRAFPTRRVPRCWLTHLARSIAIYPGTHGHSAEVR